MSGINLIRKHRTDLDNIPDSKVVELSEQFAEGFSKIYMELYDSIVATFINDENAGTIYRLRNEFERKMYKRAWNDYLRIPENLLHEIIDDSYDYACNLIIKVEAILLDDVVIQAESRDIESFLHAIKKDFVGLQFGSLYEFDYTPFREVVNTHIDRQRFVVAHESNDFFTRFTESPSDILKTKINKWLTGATAPQAVYLLHALVKMGYLHRIPNDQSQLHRELTSLGFTPKRNTLSTYMTKISPEMMDNKEEINKLIQHLGP